ncbi:MAG: 4-hydroxy-tetrahydrodipicolinate synthase [Anaerolineales bacterium]|nr:4-hydroxy-tetrahydrodipicolinate synthase [Anaerolineales bacterium]
MEPSYLSLAGTFPPIPTPFTADGDVDFDHLKSNIAHWNEDPLPGYVVGGSNGEFVFLSVDERVAVIREARGAIPADRLLIAGSGMESTRETIELTQAMADVGADAVIVVTPSYYTSKMNPPALENHYRAVAEASPLPVILYSVPVFTGIDLPVEVVRRLAPHERIVGIKDSGGSAVKIASLVNQTPADFQVLAGSASFVLSAMAVGAVGMVAALANIAGERLAALVEYFDAGDLQQARDIQLSVLEVNAAVTSKFGVAGLKAAMDMMGLFGGPVRAPLLPLNQEEEATLRTILKKADLL